MTNIHKKKGKLLKYTKKEQIEYQKNKIKYHQKRLEKLGIKKDEIIKIIKEN